MAKKVKVERGVKRKPRVWGGKTYWLKGLVHTKSEAHRLCHSYRNEGRKARQVKVGRDYWIYATFR
jgi:hypothetical protein